jgi:multicomponent Na+:H+ antiporter subunit D
VSWLLVLPIIIPLGAATIALLSWRSPRVQASFAITGGVALLIAALALAAQVSSENILVTQVGGWPSPVGITLVADLFSAILVAVASVIGLSVLVYSIADIDSGRKSYGFYPLVMVLLSGVCGAFLTGDIFNLYVWFEVLLISSFVLLSLGGTRDQLAGGLKYVALNLMASAMFLAALGILYGIAGTLNMADLSVKLAIGDRKGLVTAVAVLFLVGFGIKAAIFPLFFWLPAAYPTPPAAVSALFSGLLSKVGVYALIRVFTLLFTQDVPFTHGLILVLAGLTMVSGVLGAVAQNEFRRLLSFHIVSQIGYMLMGLGLFIPLGVGAAAYFIVHNIFAKSNLFLISGVVHRLSGSYQLKSLGGIYRERPGLSALFLIAALSLAGIPPLSGFIGKLALVRAGLEAGQYAIVATSLAVSFLTLFSMIKLWNEVFWKPAPSMNRSGQALPRAQAVLMVPIVGLATLTVGLGLFPGLFFELFARAGEQLCNPGEYVRAVIGGER